MRYMQICTVIIFPTSQQSFNTVNCMIYIPTMKSILYYQDYNNINSELLQGSMSYIKYIEIFLYAYGIDPVSIFIETWNPYIQDNLIV